MDKRTTWEQYIITTALRFPEVLQKTHLEPRWFNVYRKVVLAYQSMSKRGIDIEPFTLADELEGFFTMPEVVRWHIDGSGVPGNFEMYVNKLRLAYQADEAVITLETAIQEIKETDSMDKPVAEMMQRISDLSNIDSETYNYTMSQALMLFIDETEKEIDDSKSLKIGFPDVDEALGGLNPSDMMVVGARPGSGKTSFALSIILNVARQGKKVGFVSTEMAVTQLTGRLISMVSGIPTTQMRTATGDELLFPRIASAAKQLDSLNIRIYDKPNMTAGSVITQSRAWAMDGGIDLIIIDYLTRVKSDNPTGNPTVDVGEVATSFKNLARMLNIPVIVLAQLNRGSENRADRRPRMSDLRDSGVIEQEADQVLLLYRPEADGETKNSQGDEIIIDKNRHGQSGITRAYFKKETATWLSEPENY